MNPLERKKANRFLALEQAYTLSDGDPQNWFEQKDISAKTALSEAEMDPLLRYLVEEGLLRLIGEQGLFGITHRGVREYETAINEPAAPTQYFPPVNIIHIGQMHQSQIQQGTVDSVQTQHAVPSPADLRALIEEVRVAELALSQEDRQTLKSDLDTAEAQLNRPRPKHHVIRESLASARNILEEAGGHLLAIKLAQTLGLPPL